MQTSSFRSSLIAAFTIVLLATCPCFAWGPDGHRIVALIAADHLTPAAQAEVKALFGTSTLADWANWPDEIRQERPETAKWHFVDIPVSASTYDEKRDGNGGNNVIDAIAKEEEILGDRTQPKKDRAEALSFVCHLIGDEHQPLHTADRDDRGGNSRLVFLLDNQGRAPNLHSVWDSGILKIELGSRSDAVAATALEGKISKADVEKWSKGTITDWANESHELAVRVVYAGVPADGKPPRLDKAYVDRATETINTQLERGGIRLASELNRILGHAPTTQATTLATTQPIDH